MEKLLKIHAVIRQIEELTMETKYHSEFHYRDERYLNIKCYCKRHAINIMNMLDDTRGTSWYFVSNCEIKILEYDEKA